MIGMQPTSADHAGSGVVLPPVSPTKVVLVGLVALLITQYLRGVYDVCISSRKGTLQTLTVSRPTSIR